jgi:hypothetical protein
MLEPGLGNSVIFPHGNVVPPSFLTAQLKVGAFQSGPADVDFK